MIEYLEQLLDDQEYEKALALAEQLLLDTADDPTQQVAIYSAIVNARLNLKDYSGTVVAGEIAVRLAGENRKWDYFGKVCVDVGVACYCLREWEQAINAWTQFLTALTWYQKCSMLEPAVRYNLGLAQNAMGEFTQACHSMEQAILAANRFGNEHIANGARLALIGSLLKAGNLIPIPRLLIQCKRYIRTHQSDYYTVHSGLWHASLCVEYALATNRLGKARRLALRAVFDPDAKSDQLFSFHMILARVARRQGSAVDALGHSLAARVHAERCQRNDLLVEADDFTAKLVGDPLTLMQTLDSYLLDSVLPLREELDVSI